jgi:hypothetical protein
MVGLHPPSFSLATPAANARNAERLIVYAMIEICSSGLCHENVTQGVENGGKCEANGDKRRRKQFARSCPNLLNSLD